jgi:hypothetical protein
MIGGKSRSAAKLAAVRKNLKLAMAAKRKNLGWAVRHQADVRNVGSRTPVRGSVVTTRAELLRLPLLPDRGVAEPLGDGLLHRLLLSCGASTAPSGLEPPGRLHSCCASAADNTDTIRQWPVLQHRLT